MPSNKPKRGAPQNRRVKVQLLTNMDRNEPTQPTPPEQRLIRGRGSFLRRASSWGVADF
jgi:hypothetical protein